jgi:hypothetical protein
VVDHGDDDDHALVLLLRRCAVAALLRFLLLTHTHTNTNQPKTRKQTHTLKAAEHRPLLTTLFAKYVDAALEYCKKAFKTVVPLPAVNQVGRGPGGRVCGVSSVCLEKGRAMRACWGVWRYFLLFDDGECAEEARGREKVACCGGGNSSGEPQPLSPPLQ